MVSSDFRGQAYKFPPIAITYSPVETNILRLPHAFTRCLDRKLPERIHLRDQYGNDWTVITRESGYTTYILQGWSKFIAENFVNLGDVFIFRYDEVSLFGVNLFGLDGCETQGASRGLIKSDEEEPDSDEHEFSTEEDTYEALYRIPSERRQRMDPPRPDLVRLGRLQQPNNPYFVTRIRKSRRNELHVPFEIILLFKLTLPRDIVLRDSAGRKWRAKLKRWGDGRQLYNGGWKDLCEANSITEQDLCICEFARRRIGDICLQIDFARDLA